MHVKVGLVSDATFGVTLLARVQLDFTIKFDAGAVYQ
jgi:hypothetical protein